jgi:hypothetical protein
MNTDCTDKNMRVVLIRLDLFVSVANLFPERTLPYGRVSDT